MKKILPTIPVLILFLNVGYAKAQQQPDSLKTIQSNYYAQQFGLNNAAALKTFQIINLYKESVKILLSKGLSEVELRAKIDLLIDEKNEKLKKILTTEQLEKIVPKTELQKKNK
ncbi:hypothetical protein [Solitalea lacus]|uniref:hypothetical protein n=1 Tax=Solitalea lacus TaxID=2911172 RepID=UPI001EDC15D1|nr:hypothetical protein [Solitalea lacus]UKJ06176.1 hypothetical protein L2B55_11570 [Solitalea lacus]